MIVELTCLGEQKWSIMRGLGGVQRGRRGDKEGYAQYRVCIYAKVYIYTILY